MPSPAENNNGKSQTSTSGSNAGAARGDKGDAGYPSKNPGNPSGKGRRNDPPANSK